MADGSAEGDDVELLARVRGGDHEAFAELYQRHVLPVRRLARSLTRNAAEAEDLVAEAFFRVLQVVRRGSGPVDNARPYLMAIVRRVAVEWRNRHAEILVDDLELAGASVADDTPTGRVEVEMLARAFNSLPARWRRVLWHVEVEGSGPSSVAGMLGLTANATAQLAHRAREGLRAAYVQAHLRETERPLDCQPVVAKLGAYSMGRLRTRDTEKVRSHLSWCRSCRNLHAELDEVGAALRLDLGVLLAAAVPLFGLAGQAALTAGTAGLAASGSAGGVGAAAAGSASGVAAAGSASGVAAVGATSGSAVGTVAAAGTAAGAAVTGTASGAAAGAVAASSSAGVMAFVAPAVGVTAGAKALVVAASVAAVGLIGFGLGAAPHSVKPADAAGCVGCAAAAPGTLGAAPRAEHAAGGQRGVRTTAVLSSDAPEQSGTWGPDPGSATRPSGAEPGSAAWPSGAERSGAGAPDGRRAAAGTDGARNGNRDHSAQARRAQGARPDPTRRPPGSTAPGGTGGHGPDTTAPAPGRQQGKPGAGRPGGHGRPGGKGGTGRSAPPPDPRPTTRPTDATVPSQRPAPPEPSQPGHPSRPVPSSRRAS